MKIHSAEEAKQRFETLPQEIKELLYSPEMSLAMQQVGSKNKLHIDQIDYLNNITGQVLLGFLETKDYPQELTENLSIDRAKADAIAQDVNDMLFVKVREQMQKVYEQNKTQPQVVGVGEAPKPEPKPTAPAPAPTAQTPPTPPAPPATPPSGSTTPTLPVKTMETDMHQADKILSEPTVSKPPIPPASGPATGSTSSPQAKNYTTDPYREPPVP